MLSNAVLLIGGYLLPLASFWVFVLWVRPAVARARVEREILAIRDRLVDARAREDISPSNPRARDIIELCEFIAMNSHEITLSNVIAFQVAMRRAGVDTTSADAEMRCAQVSRDSEGLATPTGQGALQQADLDFQRVIATYLVQGSALWLVLAPAQRIRRLVHKQAPTDRDSGTIHDLLPGALAGTNLRLWRTYEAGASRKPAHV
jgi:hypothetical protein